MKIPKFNIIVIIFILCLLILVSRFPFFEKTPYEWDSVNFILAVEKFDILNDRPHPPGYIGYVGLSKLIDLAIHDAQSAHLMLNLLFSITLLVGTYVLAKQLYDSNTGIVASLILVFNPIVWFYGEIVSVYLAGAAVWVWCVYLFIRIIDNRKHPCFKVAAFVLGIIGSIRPDIAIFLIPLGIYTLISVGRLDKWFDAVIFYFIGISIWLIPTINSTGSSFFPTLESLFLSTTGNYSILTGASLEKHLIMWGKSLIWFSIGLWWAIPLLLDILIRGKMFLNLREKLLFTAIFPLMFFQLLFHLVKPGYILIYLPGLIIVAAGWVKNLQKTRIYYIAFIIIISAAYFLLTPAFPNPPGRSISSKRTNFFINNLNILSQSRIQCKDEYTRIWTENIKSNYHPDSTVIFVQGGNFDWRRVSYQLSEFITVQFDDNFYPVQLSYRNNITPIDERYSLPMGIKRLIILSENDNLALKSIGNKGFLRSIKLPQGIIFFEYHLMVDS